MKHPQHLYIPALLALIVLSLSGCHNLIQGGGDIVERIAYKDSTGTVHFTEIEVNAEHNVFLHQAPYTEVKITGYENLVPHVSVHEEGNRYIIDMLGGQVFENNNIYIHITSPAYTKIFLNGEASITSLDSLQGTSLEVQNNGSGTISIFGDMQRVTAYSAGSGITRLCGLQADTVGAFMLGSGILSTKPVMVLNAQVQGSGQIQYLGAPVVNSTITGSGGVLNALGCY